MMNTGNNFQTLLIFYVFNLEFLWSFGPYEPGYIGSLVAEENALAGATNAWSYPSQLQHNPGSFHIATNSFPDQQAHPFPGRSASSDSMLLVHSSPAHHPGQLMNLLEGSHQLAPPWQYPDHSLYTTHAPATNPSRAFDQPEHFPPLPTNPSRTFNELSNELPYTLNQQLTHPSLQPSNSEPTTAAAGMQNQLGKRLLAIDRFLMSDDDPSSSAEGSLPNPHRGILPQIIPADHRNLFAGELASSQWLQNQPDMRSLYPIATSFGLEVPQSATGKADGGRSTARSQQFSPFDRTTKTSPPELAGNFWGVDPESTLVGEKKATASEHSASDPSQLHTTGISPKSGPRRLHDRKRDTRGRFRPTYVSDRYKVRKVSISNENQNALTLPALSQTSPLKIPELTLDQYAFMCVMIPKGDAKLVHKMNAQTASKLSQVFNMIFYPLYPRNLQNSQVMNDLPVAFVEMMGSNNKSRVEARYQIIICHHGKRTSRTYIDVQNKLTVLFKRLWYMNRRILHLFGISADSEVFDSRQKQMMTWVIHQLVKPEASLPVFGLTCQIPAHDTVPFGAIQKQVIEFISHPQAQDKIKAVVRNIHWGEVVEEDAIACKLSIYVLAVYYSRAQPMIWKHTFICEDQYLLTIQNMFSSLSRSDIKTFMKNNAWRFDISGLPWNEQ